MFVFVFVFVFGFGFGFGSVFVCVFMFVFVFVFVLEPVLFRLQEVFTRSALQVVCDPFKSWNHHAQTCCCAQYCFAKDHIKI